MIRRSCIVKTLCITDDCIPNALLRVFESDTKDGGAINISLVAVANAEIPGDLGDL